MSGRAPGMRLHPRTMEVSRAASDLREYLLDWQAEYELTDIEAAITVSAEVPHMLKYLLRAERHPDDPERKADEG